MGTNTVVSGAWTPWLDSRHSLAKKSGMEGWWENEWTTLAVLYERNDGLLQCATYATTDTHSHPRGCGIAYTRDYFRVCGFTEVPADRWPRP